jgi:hypothetical protein
MMNDNLAALATKIGATLATKPQIFITHPAELRVFQLLSSDQLHQFAAERGWRTVSRLGGRQIEFYNDAIFRADL